ncbi:MAG: 3-oxoacyl-[acyl-carrier-protein] synthase III C-terminal domain-containing protein [Bacillota bacterium]|nr:3-oxoacyl-[acyl-carrier-protein] synthase III C-terminal domain-containing protein [Bacillota bacterium]
MIVFSSGTAEYVSPATALIIHKEIQGKNECIAYDMNASNGFSSTVDTIEKLLRDSGLTTKDITLYCFSQLSKGNTEKICEGLNEDFNKFYFIGNEYGYTGTSSPLIVLEKAIKNGRLQRGHYLMFWSLGAGSTACTMLYKF